MNNKGQSGVIFIILIPVFMIILAFITDGIMQIEENTRFKSTTKEIMKDVLTNSYNDKVSEAKTLYEENKFETEMLEASYEEPYLTIYNSHSYESFFGKIVGVKSYRVEVHYKAHMEDNKLIVEEIKEEG